MDARDAERERDEASLETNIVLTKSRSMDSADAVHVSVCGYRGSLTCQTAFDETLKLLDQLQERVGRREWDDPTRALLTLLYGSLPEGRGMRIINYVKCFAKDPVLAAGAHSVQVPAQPGAGEYVYDELKRLVSEEKECVAGEERIYQRQQKKRLTAGHGSRWLPTTSNWNVVLKQDASLDRQIESKAKLLMRLKNHDAAAERKGDWEAKRLAAGGDSESRQVSPDYGQGDPVSAEKMKNAV